MDSTLNSTPHLESSWVSTYEPLPPLASSHMPLFVVSPPKLELKPLLDSLKYVFLGLKDTLLVIISTLLSCYQEKELTCILSNRKANIRWSVAKLKGISPTICILRG